MNISVHLGGSIFIFPRNKIAGSLEACTFDFTKAAPFYIPPGTGELCHIFFCILVPLDVKWLLTVVLICISIAVDA